MTESALEYAVHPLVVLHLTDHVTRSRCQRAPDAAPPPGLVFGVLVGTLDSRRVEACAAFEAHVHDAGDAWTVDAELLRARAAQYKEVFPEYDPVGWYSTAGPDPRLHAQFAAALGDLPLYAHFDLAESAGARQQHDQLPLALYESRTVDTATVALHPVDEPPRVVAGDAERIAVDTVAKGAAAAMEGALATHLQGQRTALEMLCVRVRAMLEWARDVHAGRLPADLVLLRRVAHIARRLPAPTSPEFTESFARDYNDVLLTVYLAVLGKATLHANEAVDKTLAARPQVIPGSTAAAGMNTGAFERMASAGAVRRKFGAAGSLSQGPYDRPAGFDLGGRW